MNTEPRRAIPDPQRYVDAGIRVPTRVDARPWRLAGKRRPKIVAFFLRLLSRR